MERLPNLMIAGVNKAGTTSLYSYLSRHGDICPSSIKETCYFLPLRYGEPLPPFEDYMKLFRHWSGQRYLMEATPGYFYGGSKLANGMRERLGNPRIVFLFRNPSERAFSFFRSLKGKTLLPSEMTFGEYIEECQKRLSRLDLHDRRQDHFYRGLLDGLYIDYLNDWYEHFCDSIRVMFFEQLKSNPLLFMNELSKWLDIDPEAYTTNEFAIENRTVHYKHKRLHQLAIVMNKFLERQLRRHPRLKQSIRTAYFGINESQTGESMLEAERKQLDSVYCEHNQRLRSSLMEKGYSAFPDWLTER